MKLKADVYPFSHHNVFIPEHLKIMLEGEIETSKHNNINSWLNDKYRGDWSIQAIKQVINGRTQSPSVHLLEDVRRVCTKTGVSSKYDFPQLPLIRTTEIRRIVGEDAGLSYKHIATALGIDQPTLGNTVNDKVQYRYLTAWSLTHFFVKYFVANSLSLSKCFLVSIASNVNGLLIQCSQFSSYVKLPKVSIFSNLTFTSAFNLSTSI